MIVVDSSFALQWVLPESGRELAESLMQRSDLAAPDIVLIEVANVLAKKVRAKEFDLSAAKDGLDIVRKTFARLEATLPLLPRGLELSAALAHPVYDCLFLACALQLDTVVVTRDAPFADRAAAAGYGPSVLFNLTPEASRSGEAP